MVKVLNLLLVEDDPSVRQAITNVLVSEHYQVWSTAAPKTAVQTCAEAAIDVVILDLNLAGADGWTVFNSIKAVKPNLPIIVTSAQPERLTQRQPSAGFATLEKPFDIASLLDLLSVVLRPAASLGQPIPDSQPKNSHPAEAPVSASPARSMSKSIQRGIASLKLKRLLRTVSLILLGACPWLAEGQTSLAVPSITIKLQVQNGMATVSWPSGATTNKVQLQSASSITGPWQNVGSPTTASSVSTPMPGPIGFYRLLVATNSGSADTTPPSVSLAAPAAGSTLSGSVALTANASDNTGVTRVEFYCDSLTTPIGTASAAPFTASCDTTTLPNGSHNLFCRAYDAAGNSAISANVGITVNNTAIATGQTVWVQAMLSQGGNAPVNGVAADHAGNTFAAGYFEGTVNFGSGPISSVPVSTEGNAFLLKYGPGGTLAWSKLLRGTGNDVARGTAVDSQNNVFVVGNFQGTLDFGGGPLSSLANENMFVAKYSPSGTFLWAKRLGGTYSDAACCVAVDGNDNVLVAGRFTSLNADYGNGFTLSASGSQSIALLKLSGSTGSTLWAKSYGGSGYNQPQGLAVDRNGDVVVTGFFLTATDLGGGSLASAGAGDVFLAKYSGTDGSYKWGKRMGSAGGDSGIGLAIDPVTGNIVLAGSFTGTVNFGGGLLDTLNNGGIYMAGFDPYGNYLWNIGAGGSGDAGTGVTIDSNGNLALTGKASNALYFGGSQSLLGDGQVNVFVASFTLSGNSAPAYRWAKTVGPSSTGASTGNGVAFDSLGHIVTGGGFMATTDFGGVTVTAGAPGYSSGFLTQYDK